MMRQNLIFLKEGSFVFTCNSFKVILSALIVKFDLMGCHLSLQ